jgi:hypothetical protein
MREEVSLRHQHRGLVRLRRCAGLLLAALLALGALSAAVSALPGNGPRETINQTFTTTRPGSPTGFGFSASYHAVGDKQAPPPYLRRMVFYPPRGLRYDTSVPPRCSASDPQLQLMGPAACPGSVLGRGTVEGLIMEPFAHDFVFDHFKHPIYILNAKAEQILLVHSEGFTVVRGHFRRDGSLNWVLPSCFPSPPGGKCVDDYVVQLKTNSSLRPYTRKVAGRLRSYGTTPSGCPHRGYWRTTVRHWWSDGSVDTVATKQPCRQA